MKAFISLPTLCRFSGDFDIHYFVSAKKLTKWAAAFGESGRAHVVMQCDSVQILQPNSQEFCRWFVFFLKGDLSQRYPTKQDVDHGGVCITCTWPLRDWYIHAEPRTFSILDKDRDFCSAVLAEDAINLQIPSCKSVGTFFLNICDICLYKYHL